MDWYVHAAAIPEYRDLPDDTREAIRADIEARMVRTYTITDQRGVGICYDRHGNPLHYCKVDDIDYRVFFRIRDDHVILVGFRPRDADTYKDLRQLTRRLQE